MLHGLAAFNVLLAAGRFALDEHAELPSNLPSPRKYLIVSEDGQLLDATVVLSRVRPPLWFKEFIDKLL